MTFWLSAVCTSGRLLISAPGWWPAACRCHTDSLLPFTGTCQCPVTCSPCTGGLPPVAGVDQWSSTCHWNAPAASRLSPACAGGLPTVAGAGGQLPDTSACCQQIAYRRCRLGVSHLSPACVAVNHLLMAPAAGVLPVAGTPTACYLSPALAVSQLPVPPREDSLQHVTSMCQHLLPTTGVCQLPATCCGHMLAACHNLPAHASGLGSVNSVHQWPAA